MNGATLPLYVAKWGRFLRQAMQETLQKAYEARMGLIAQQQDMHGKLTPSDIARHRSHIATRQETELVKEEFDTIEDRGRHRKLWQIWQVWIWCWLFCPSIFSSNSWWPRNIWNVKDTLLSAYPTSKCFDFPFIGGCGRLQTGWPSISTRFENLQNYWHI